MPPTLKQSSDLIVELHEDRIQRLEDVSSETAAKVAAMEEKIESGFKYLGEKIETCIAPVTSNLARHIQDDQETEAKVAATASMAGNSQQRLDKLEDKAQKRIDRISTMKKGLWAVGLALIGAGFKACFDLMK